jgi:Fe2+ or Zn2+ uptake regulation protein
MDIKLLENRLKTSGYKITEQRKSILEVLIQCQGQFVSAETLFYKVKKIYPKINLSTIYRNLEILRTLKFVHKIIVNEESALFSLVFIDKHHHHIICKNCGKTEVIPFCPIENLKALAEEKGFDLTHHKLELYGYCESCRINKENL